MHGSNGNQFVMTQVNEILHLKDVAQKTGQIQLKKANILMQNAIQNTINGAHKYKQWKYKTHHIHQTSTPSMTGGSNSPNYSGSVLVILQLKKTSVVVKNMAIIQEDLQIISIDNILMAVISSTSSLSSTIIT
ncbi:hypothetical protein PVAND_008999 [Polypedilum vanderplanki]|uniref:Uncharacterized protein n=1 Tax=Polypedilum vanderplanki TaxID=319348 RepID=A0A9J6CC46_POLVA|nr:hypothetical protein PVAND_008999 [Polypedilum vanderplanki]